MDVSLMTTSGAQSVKPSKFVPMGTRRLFTGLTTNRNPLMEAGTRSEARFYGGRPDGLIDGLNLEVSSKNTLIRRPGFSLFSTATLPGPVISYYPFHQTATKSLTLVVDTPTTISTLTPTAATTVLTKSPAAGRSYFQAVGNQLFMADGVDNVKWDLTTLSNWGIVAPVSAPALSFSTGTYTITSALGVSYLYCYLNNVTRHPSTGSPVSSYTGKKTLQTVTLTGAGSTDPQVTHIQIYRTNDGGATYYLLATILNTTTWTFADNFADTALNMAIIAPQALANEPPAAGAQNLCFYAGRIWYSVGNFVFYLAGPDCQNGSGNEASPPANYIPFPSDVISLVPYSNGNLVFTASDLHAIGGSISAAGLIAGSTGTVFYPYISQPGLGILTPDAVSVGGATIHIFTSDNQVIALNPGAGVIENGFGIADQFDGLDASTVSLAYHVSGHKDSALFVTDGAGDMWRCNPNQAPEGGPCWSTKASVSSISKLASVEVSRGKHRLLASEGNQVWMRDWTVNSDLGTGYPCYGTIGSIVLAQPGQVAEVESVSTICKGIGSVPAVSVLIGEIEGTFEALLNSVPEPPSLPASTSVLSNRYYLKQGQQPIIFQHFQLKVDFGTESEANELLGYSCYGALHADA